MIRYILISCFLVLICTSVHAQLYVGIGPSMYVPTQDFADLNNECIGFNLQIENHYFCNLWWGAKIEYFEFDRIETLPAESPYLVDYFAITPNVKFNLMDVSIYGDNSCNGKFIPYINLGVIMSISDTFQPETDKFGIGGNAGVGFAYGFTFLNACMMLDLNATYNSANFLYKDDVRNTINSLIVGLNLSVRL
ncbi:MAG: hypothetical protein IAE98_04755 [Candidatus Kapabacteria bacterium]|nr:hypothetical protein [Candidatus Kapabacteria bacterium]